MDVIIPCLDPELHAYMRIRKELSKMGIQTFLPRAEGLKAPTKIRLTALM